MKKERLFYLDFVRAIAAISIVITHFNAKFIFLDPPMVEKAVLTTTVGKSYIGDWGVSLFFIISGAALMYVYNEKCEWKTFYKKRFLSIYPMFWMAYVLGFVYFVIVNHVIPGSVLPKWRFLFSVAGFDGLLAANGFPTYYLLGEWFLGVIILVYILFPVLRKVLNEKPVLFVVLVILSYAGGLLLCYKGPYPASSTCIFVRIPELAVGMFFGKYVRKVDWKAAAAAVVVLILNQIWTSLAVFSKVLSIPAVRDIRVTYVGAASFIVLAFLSEYLKNAVTERVCGIVSKYSYAIFLVHHIIIEEVMRRRDLLQMSVLESYVMFALICCIIACFAWGLYFLHAKIMKQLSRVGNKKVI